MLEANYNDPQTYRRTLMIYSGEAEVGFVHQVKKILQRHFGQTEKSAPPEQALVHFGKVLWRLVQKHGLPAPLANADQGQDQNMPSEKLASRLDEVWRGFKFSDYRSDLEVPARHLVKGIWQPEFKKCRLSYKESDSSKNCDRQDLAKVRSRISGAHCVDCPYWVSVSSLKNEKLLTKEWNQNKVAEFTANADVFLPEDFRSLRQLLYMHARFSTKS